MNATSSSGSRSFLVSPSNGQWVWQPIMQFSHRPLTFMSVITKPSTRPLLTILWIVCGLQCVSCLCYCSSDVGRDRDTIARGTSGTLSIASRMYILLTFRPTRTMVPSALWVIPLPFPKVMIRPALSKALTDTKLALSVGA